ncbi:MAG: Rieske (2Fe-2S) protein [Chloroflexi bacterium]|nr:Rieske (2Fe-2S) protein [Chloroflexota bacterium]
MTHNAQSSSAPVTRRGFIQVLLGFSVVSTVVGILTPVIGYLLPKSAAASSSGPVEVGAVADFPAGQAKIVSVNDKPVIIINNKTGGMKAYSAICTHLGCIVSWNDRKNSIMCPCHDGFFNPVTGAVVSGPPPKPLPSFELIVRDGKVLIGKQVA